jgi:lipoyl(octanoyl) transferase
VTAALPWTWLGRVAYGPALALQEAQRERVLAGTSDGERILFVEHEPVVTLGRSATLANLRVPAEELARRGIELERVSRGGDVTAHAPGQLVIYPIVRLRHGVLQYVCRTGEAIADELQARGVAGAHFRRDPVGVFVGEAKIAACGVHVSRRVSIHGWALNVTRAPLEVFAHIVPCGLTNVRVTCMEDELASPPPTLASLCEPLAERLSRALTSIDRSSPCHHDSAR